MATLKSLANSQNKAELYSVKNCLATIRTTYKDKDGDTRRYIDSLGIKGKQLDELKWQDFDGIVQLNKKGFCSIWSMLNAIAVVAKCHMDFDSARKEVEAKAIKAAAKAAAKAEAK